MNNEEWINETKQKHPTVFASTHRFNFNCGIGWKDIINNLLDKLVEIYPEIKVTQIKEKFGTLRFYTAGIPEEKYYSCQAEIRNAEQLSAVTCEWCGKEGSQDVSRYWVVTLCPDCRDKR